MLVKCFPKGRSMDYITVTEAAKKINKTRSWVHQLIQSNRIPGAKTFGPQRLWIIPRNFKVLPMLWLTNGDKCYRNQPFTLAG